jgi:ATP-dependent Clp endopeptidase proteolytic subunit ClpP
MRSTRRLTNLAGPLPRWYSISNAVSGQPTQVTIYDEIGFFGVAAGDFMADLKGINGDIQLHINSPGGDVHDGLAIYNQLKQRKGDVHVIVDGLAASAASFIAMAASPGKLEMAPHSQMMIHNGFSMAIGDAADLRKTADLLDKVTTEIASIYSERSGKPVQHFLDLMAAETWLSDKEAVAEGLADGIHGQEAAKNSWDLSVYANADLSDIANWEIVDETGDPEDSPIENVDRAGINYELLGSVLAQALEGAR